MRLRNISEISVANQFLKKEFLSWFDLNTQSNQGRKPISIVGFHNKRKGNYQASFLATLKEQSKMISQLNLTSNGINLPKSNQPPFVPKKESYWKKG